jgi:hypothetical protein
MFTHAVYLTTLILKMQTIKQGGIGVHPVSIEQQNLRIYKNTARISTQIDLNRMVYK